jgi:hypothetical protein
MRRRKSSVRRGRSPLRSVQVAHAARAVSSATQQITFWRNQMTSPDDQGEQGGRARSRRHRHRSSRRWCKSILRARTSSSRAIRSSRRRVRWPHCVIRSCRRVDRSTPHAIRSCSPTGRLISRRSQFRSHRQPNHLGEEYDALSTRYGRSRLQCDRLFKQSDCLRTPSRRLRGSTLWRCRFYDRRILSTVGSTQSLRRRTRETHCRCERSFRRAAGSVSVARQ